MIFSIATRATIEVSDAAVLFPFPLQIGTGLVQIDTLEYKFALYSLYRVQICTLPYRSANLYFNTQECKFVLRHTGVQICTSPYKSANLHLIENKSITYNKFAFDISIIVQLSISSCLYLLQMYIGPYQPPNSAVASVESTADLQVGQLVAIYCQDCPTEPSIGETTNLFGEEIELKWMEGTYSTVWTYCRISSDSDKRRRVEWVQKVPRSSILLYGFELTKGKHLKKNTVIKLKELYSELRDK